MTTGFYIALMKWGLCKLPADILPYFTLLLKNNLYMLYSQLIKKKKFEGVLGLARTGLIFTRSQEGTQPGGLTPPGQTEQGIPYCVLSCRALAGGSGWRKGSCGSGVCGGRWELLSAFCCFVLCILLIGIVVVPVPLAGCSVKLS